MKTLYQQNFWHLHVCNKLYYVQQHNFVWPREISKLDLNTKIICCCCCYRVSKICMCLLIGFLLMNKWQVGL